MNVLSGILDLVKDLLGYAIFFVGYLMLGTFLFIGPLAFGAVFLLKEMYVLSGLSLAWAGGGIVFACWLFKNPHSNNQSETDFVYYQQSLILY